MEASYKGWVYAKLNGATVPSRPLLNLPYQTQRWLRSGNVGPFESRFCDFIQKQGFSISKNLGQKSIFFFGITIFVKRAYYQGLQLPHLDHPQKNPFPSYGSFSGAHPGFWTFGAIPTSEV